jgi:hypothetical protein
MKLGYHDRGGEVLNTVTKFTVRIKQKGSSVFRRVIHNFGHLLFGRVSLVIFGLLILTAAAEVINDLYAGVIRPGSDVEEMLHDVEGISSLFLGVGLILKERQQLRLIFGLIPAHKSSLEDWRDSLCHNMGLCLLLIGTAMSLSAQLIRIPDRIIPTQGQENIIFAFGLLFCLLAFIILLYLLIRLTFGQRVRQPM